MVDQYRCHKSALAININACVGGDNYQTGKQNFGYSQYNHYKHNNIAGGDNSRCRENKNSICTTFENSWDFGEKLNAQRIEIPPTTTVSACFVLGTYPTCALASADNPGGLG